MFAKKWKVMAVTLALLTACVGAVPAVSAQTAVLATEKEDESKTAAKLDPYKSVSQSEITRAFEEYRYDEVQRAETVYEKAPLLTGNANMEAGELTTESLQDALDAVNLLRTVAGVEPIVENVTFTEKAQQAASLLAYLGQLTSSPTQPLNLEDDFYEDAYDGAQNSNLRRGSKNLAQAIFADAAASEKQLFSSVSTRRWLLSAGVEEAGFGFAERGGQTYTAAYLMDDPDDDDTPFTHDLAWPAQNMPLELFDKTQPWSISLGDDYDDPSLSRIKVSLQKRGAKRVWKFDSNSANLAISNQELGQGKTIIFWPVNATYESGDIYDVKIEGLKGKAKTLEYSVTFFNAVNSNKKPGSSSGKNDPAEQYQAIFRTQGASGETPKATVSKQNKVTMPKAETFEKPGSEFLGWMSSSDGKVYQPGQALILTEDTTFTAQWKPNPSRTLELDTKTAKVAVNGAYQFLVRGNNDTEKIQVEVANPGIAEVTLARAGDVRGAMYEVRGLTAGSTQVRVTYREQTVTMQVQVTPSVSRGSITLDTAQYSMAPKNRYTIGNVIRDATGRTLTGAEVQALVQSGKLKVSDSRTGSVVELRQLANGNYEVTGKTVGTCYVIYEIGGTHASVRIDVEKRVQQHGSAVRNTSYFTTQI